MKHHNKLHFNAKHYIALILAALILLFAVYVNDYYHADADAKAALNGNEAVTVTTQSGGTILFTPAGDTPDLHTGLIFYPGGKVEYTAYAPLMEQFAERGITCILVKMPFNLAFLDVNAAGKVQKPASVEHWYIVGHSLGGVAAAMYLGSGHADEFEGLLLTGSYSSTDLSDTDLSVLTIVGEKDGLVTQDKVDAHASSLPADSEEYVIPGGCHAYFGSYGRQKGDGEPAITADEQRQITADTAAAWMTR